MIHRGVILDGGALPCLVKGLGEAAVEALDNEEDKQHQQNGHCPVKAERVGKRNGDKPADNAAAGHILPVNKEPAGKVLQQKLLGNCRIKEKMTERSDNNGNHQSGRDAQRHGVALMKAEDNRRH